MTTLNGDGSSSYQADPADTLSTDVAEAGVPRRQLAVLWCFAIGVVAALIGMLPWLVTGMRFPLEKLLGTSPNAEATPAVVQMFSQYMLTLIGGLIVTGSAIAGVAARATRARHPRHGLRAVLLGVLLVQVIAAAQITVVIMTGLQGSAGAGSTLAALVTVVLVSLLIGILVVLLITKSPVPGATIGLGIAAIAAGIWADALVAPFGIISDELTASRLHNVQWIPAVIVGLAIAWAGYRTVGRVSAAVAALLILWIARAVFVGVRVATDMLAGASGEILNYGLESIVMVLWPPGVALLQLMVAVTVAALGWFIRFLLRSRANAAAQAGAESR
ncbi:hypothetical protein [Salinibacterium sp. ZJ450]|uniref:hypothetical protein n=1 Tax=Salinibacterium sp. ZJ450 TaxID=2708338 RepID=UPI0014226F0E|nr:hypothetical protein [Salinibacterium sp. ZJ450]